MALLGDDGLGYHLARQLEASGVWRPWLGDSCYANFVRFLESPSSWEAFMGVDDAKSRAQIKLQLRARALLFDKACVSLSIFPLSNSSSTSSAIDVSKLNPSYLQLHGDDVYYTLEHNSQDGAQQRDAPVASNSAPCKIQGKTTSSSGSRYGESAIDNKSQRHRHEELLDSWYTQFIEKFEVVRPYKLLSMDLERTPGEMVAYLGHLEKYKRRRILLKEDHRNSTLEFRTNVHSNSILATNNCVEDDTPFFPEIMYTWNCVPESALPVSTTDRAEDNQKNEFYGVLDTLPDIVPRSRNAIMIERLGIRPESVPMAEQGENLCRAKNGFEVNRKHIGEEQAFEISKKMIARMLLNVGFECATEVPVRVLSQLLTSHISKLGCILKVLADSYKKQCSAIELIKMFLQTSGYSNLGALAEHAKESRTVSTQQIQPHPQVFQTQSQPQNPSPILQNNQVPRQLHAPMPMQQTTNPQNLDFQQNQPRKKQQQTITPRPVMNSPVTHRERPLVQVKMEVPEFPVDGNAFNAGIAMSNRHSQLQARQQQQYATLSNLQTQAGNHFRQLPSQTPQIHAQGMGTVRAPPVKVEAFQELMGGDTTPKHDLDENRLTSPSK